jgi:hypothetical protein
LTMTDFMTGHAVFMCEFYRGGYMSSTGCSLMPLHDPVSSRAGLWEKWSSCSGSSGRVAGELAHVGSGVRQLLQGAEPARRCSFNGAAF